MSSGEEKRQHQRVPMVLRVHVPDQRNFYAVTENLSRGGLFIQTDEDYALGQVVPLALSFPGLMDPIEIVGHVAWVRQARGDDAKGIGVRVDDDAYRKRLETLVNAGTTSSGPAAPGKFPPEGYRVLIVEDNPHIIEMYSYVLKKLATTELGGKVPLEVHFSPDGHGALKLLTEGKFNLVMTDLYMPVMDGFQLVEKIRSDERLKSIPVIAISAGGKDAQERAMAAGVDIFLRKPVKFVEVLETVKTLLRIQ
ncbi:MAG: TIGR02266 family protein [Myxococcaceae bacterium]